MSKLGQRSDSAFSKFFRNASKAEREAVFAECGKKATEAQNQTLKLNEAIVKAADLTQELLLNLDNKVAAKELHELMESFKFDDQVVITKGATALLIQRRTSGAA